MTRYDYFEKVSVQFLPTDTNQKVGTLDKSLLILDLGHIEVQVHPTAACSYLAQQVSLIGCHEQS